MRSLFYRAVVSIGFLGVFLIPSIAFAASIGISPSSGSYLVGKIFPVNVYVTSTDQSINAVSATVTFPADKLQVVSASKAGSILTLWVSDPTYSNSQGTVSMEGVVPNPGYQGSGGRVVTINFQVIAQGDARVSFGDASVLANDGNGTNVLQSKNPGVFTLGNAPAVIPVEIPINNPTTPDPTPANLTPRAPIVSSPQFPDQKVWYPINKGTFSWKVPSDATAVRVLLSKQPNSTPTQVYAPAIDSKEIADIADGVWYFHVQLKNSKGWGGITHYLLRVDTLAPETFNIKQISNPDATDPQPKFSFAATDATSGVNHYLVQIDSMEARAWTDDGSGVFKAPVLGPGLHTLVAKAFDEAGNFATASINFSIQGITPPNIISFTEQVTATNPLIVRGTGPKGDSVRIILTRNDGDPVTMTVVVGEDGLFVGAIESSKLKSGVYRLSAVSVDSRGAESVPTQEKTVLVNASWFRALGASLTNILSVLVPILSLLFLLIFVVLYGLNKIRLFKKKVGRELHDVEHMVDKAFALLKEDIEDSIHMLEHTRTKRKLTEEESKIIERLRSNLNDAEKVIHKQVRDIEKEIE